MATLDRLTLEALETMPDQRILELAGDYLRETVSDSDAIDDDDRAIVALMDAGAGAAASDRPDDHRAVTAALVDLARAVFRKDLVLRMGSTP